MQTSEPRRKDPSAGSAGRTTSIAEVKPGVSIRDILALRRRVAAALGPWTVATDALWRGAAVLDGEGTVVAKCQAVEMAQLLADLFNTWLPLCNAWYLGRRVLRDREAMFKLVEKDR